MPNDYDALEQRYERMVAAFDRYVEQRTVYHQRRKARMKPALVTLAGGSIMLVTEGIAMLLLQAQGGTPAIVQWWGPLSAIGIGLIVFSTTKTAFEAHKAHTEMRINDLVTKAEFMAEVNGFRSLMALIHQDLRELRGEMREVRKSHHHGEEKSA